MPGEYSIRTPHVGRVSTLCMKKEYNAIIEEIVTDGRTLLEHCRLVSLVWNRKNLLVPGPAFVHSHTDTRSRSQTDTLKLHCVYIEPFRSLTSTETNGSTAATAVAAEQTNWMWWDGAGDDRNGNTKKKSADK